VTRLKNDALDARCAAQGAPAGVSLTVRGADRRVGRHAAHRTDDLAIGALRPTRRRVSQAFVTGDRAGKVLASGELLAVSLIGDRDALLFSAAGGS